jgi:hypothetical protein
MNGLAAGIRPGHSCNRTTRALPIKSFVFSQHPLECRVKGKLVHMGARTFRVLVDDED